MRLIPNDGDGRDGEAPVLSGRFLAVDRASGAVVGRGSITGGRDSKRVVEIAYGISPADDARGYGLAIASELVRIARLNGGVDVVSATTPAADTGSARVLGALGFTRTTELLDPVDGPIWAWELAVRTPAGPPSRLVGETVLPSPGVWTVDPGHADVSFVGRRLGLTKVRGRFGSVTGTIVVGEHPSDSRVEISVGTGTVRTGNDEYDARLRSTDFLDVSRHGSARFTSTSVGLDETHASVRGHLTIVGVRRPVVVDVDLVGVATDPWGGDRAVFSASTEIDREDWGLTWNMALATGGLLLSKRVRIEVELEAIRTH